MYVIIVSEPLWPISQNFQEISQFLPISQEFLNKFSIISSQFLISQKFLNLLNQAGGAYFLKNTLMQISVCERVHVCTHPITSIMILSLYSWLNNCRCFSASVYDACH